jgi:hypothetical protein
MNFQDSAGSTPLHKAAQNGHLNIVILLLNWGADAKIRNSNDKTALDGALDNRRLDVARFLIGYMEDVDPQDRIDLTSLDTLLQARDSLLDFAQPFPESREGIVIPYEGEWSLHIASEEGNIQVVLSLLDSGIDVNDLNAHLETPLHSASISGRVEVANQVWGGREFPGQDRFDTIVWTSRHSPLVTRSWRGCKRTRTGRLDSTAYRVTLGSLRDCRGANQAGSKCSRTE